MRKGGRIVTCGATTGPEVSLILRQLFGREVSLLGSMLGTVDELKKLNLPAGVDITIRI